MAVKQYGVETGRNIKTYFAETTDDLESFPTGCGAGSVIIIVNRTEKQINRCLIFDGEDWVDV